MQIPEEIFRAYDIRGLVETALRPEIVAQIGRAIGSEAIARGVEALVVGWDGRLTSADLAATLSDGICATGCDVIMVGQVPTPALYYATQALNTASGVEVTASHNPPPYNGFKIMLAGETLAGTAIQRLKQRIQQQDYHSGTGRRSHQAILPQYCRAIAADITLKRPLKVAIDCGNGVAAACAPEIFRTLGCEVVELFCQVDGHFPNHHPDPSQPQNLQDLIAAVREHKAELGLAFDGDGDRLGVVTANGDIIWPDRLLILFAQAVLEQQPGAEILFDVKSTRLLPEAIIAHGGRATMWKTGHSFIKAKLRETGAALAGEMSGHIFFNERWYGFDDGIYAGCRLCELIAASGLSATALFDRLPDSVNTPELRLECAEGENYQLVDELVGKARFTAATIQTMDGLRVDFDYGFGLIRASNTAPEISMRFEADTEQNLLRIQNDFRQLLHTIRPGLQLPF